MASNGVVVMALLSLLLSGEGTASAPCGTRGGPQPQQTPGALTPITTQHHDGNVATARHQVPQRINDDGGGGGDDDAR